MEWDFTADCRLAWKRGAQRLLSVDIKKGLSFLRIKRFFIKRVWGIYSALLLLSLPLSLPPSIPLPLPPAFAPSQNVSFLTFQAAFLLLLSSSSSLLTSFTPAYSTSPSFPHLHHHFSSFLSLFFPFLPLSEREKEFETGSRLPPPLPSPPMNAYFACFFWCDAFSTANPLLVKVCSCSELASKFWARVSRLYLIVLLLLFFFCCRAPH